VKAALARGLAVSSFWGAELDLSDRLRRLGGGTTKYVRVTTRRYKEVSDEK
jgi:hypothetical protein